MVFFEVLLGIFEIFVDIEFQLVVGVIDYLFEFEEKVLFEMLFWCLFGVIIVGFEYFEVFCVMLVQVGCFVVEIMDVDGELIDVCVGISYCCVGCKMVEVIIENGYSKIGFFGIKMLFDYCVCKWFEGLI